MTDDKIQRDINRGQRADALLKDELLRECFDALEREYIEAWRNSPARDTDGRERLWQAVQVIGKMHDHLVKVLNDGKLAQNELNRLTELDAVKAKRR
jgi:hypothetical protein